MGPHRLGDRVRRWVIIWTAPLLYRQRPILEAVHNTARDEDNRAGSGLRAPAIDRHLIDALEDVKHFLLPGMDVVGVLPVRACGIR